MTGFFALRHGRVAASGFGTVPFRRAPKGCVSDEVDPFEFLAPTDEHLAAVDLGRAVHQVAVPDQAAQCFGDADPSRSATMRRACSVSALMLTVILVLRAIEALSMEACESESEGGSPVTHGFPILFLSSRLSSCRTLATPPSSLTVTARSMAAEWAGRVTPVLVGNTSEEDKVLRACQGCMVGSPVRYVDRSRFHYGQLAEQTGDPCTAPCDGGVTARSIEAFEPMHVLRTCVGGGVRDDQEASRGQGFPVARDEVCWVRTCRSAGSPRTGSFRAGVRCAQLRRARCRHTAPVSWDRRAERSRAHFPPWGSLTRCRETAERRRRARSRRHVAGTSGWLGTPGRLRGTLLWPASQSLCRLRSCGTPREICHRHGRRWELSDQHFREPNST